MKITIARFAPMIRFFVSWMLFLGGMTLAVTNLHLQSEIVYMTWFALSNEESRLVHIINRSVGKSESFVARTDDYATHYRLGDNLRYTVISPDRERIFFIEQYRIHLTDVRTGQTQTLTINGNNEVNLCSYPTWSPDSEWIAVVIDQLDCSSRSTVGVDKHVILINRNGQLTRNLFSFTSWSYRQPLWSEDSQSVYVETDERLVVSTLDGTVSTVDSTILEMGMNFPGRERAQGGMIEGLDVSVFVDRGSVTNIIVGVLLVIIALALTFWWEKVESAYRRAFPSP